MNGGWFASDRRKIQEAALAPAKPKALYDVGWMYALFVKTYGAEMLVNSAYRTEDHFIPYRLFKMMYRQIDGLEAREKYQTAVSSWYAGVMSFGGSKDGQKIALDEINRWAKFGNLK